MALYLKPFLDVPDQIALLQSRGLEITDVVAAQRCLRRVGYYRLSAYWHPFYAPTNARPPARSQQFLPNSRFEDAIALYVFDKKLKLLVMDAIERVEIALRVELSLCLGRKGPFAYLDPTQLHPKFSLLDSSGQSPLSIWQTKMTALHNQSSEEFVRHFNGNYQRPMPIWMACELWDFGMTSRLYSGLKLADKQDIAKQFSIANHALLESWIRSLNSVRNIVAHHGRLWNRFFGASPSLPRPGLMSNFDALHSVPFVNKRIYFVLCVLAHFLSVINPSSGWKSRVVALIDAFPNMPHAQLTSAGFPADWKTHAFWN